MSSLYEIDRELQSLLETGFTESCVDTETGEIDENKVKDFLESLPMDRSIKLENYGKLIKNLTIEAEAIEAEENKLKKRIEQKLKRIEWLKNSVALSMQAFGEDKFETPAVAYSFRKSVSVEVSDMSKLPAEYIKVETKEKPDKTALGKALKCGAVIEGATLIEKKNLQIN